MTVLYISTLSTLFQILFHLRIEIVLAILAFQLFGTSALLGVTVV